MPTPVNEQIKRRVIQQWLSGESRDKIAVDNNIGEGTVSSIINYFKIGLDQSEFDSARELALQTKKQGLNLSDLASHFRLHNYFLKSGATEEKVESFITMANSMDIPPERTIELVNQLVDISKTQSISLHEVPDYINKKLEEKQNIEEEIKEADTVLQSKNVNIEDINEYIQLREELRKYGLSTKDIHKLLNLLLAAKEYRYSPAKIVAKLRSIKRLENKENKLKSSCEALTKKEAKYKDIIPFTEDIAALGISVDKLLALKVGIKEAAKCYNLPPLAATLRLINDIKKYNEINGLKKEIYALSLQKYALHQVCTTQIQSLIALAKLKSHGISEEQITSLGNTLQGNQIDMKKGE